MTITGWICTVSCLLLEVVFASVLVAAAFAKRKQKKESEAKDVKEKN